MAVRVACLASDHCNRYLQPRRTMTARSAIAPSPVPYSQTPRLPQRAQSHRVARHILPPTRPQTFANGITRSQQMPCHMRLPYVQHKENLPPQAKSKCSNQAPHPTNQGSHGAPFTAHLPRMPSLSLHRQRVLARYVQCNSNAR